MPRGHIKVANASAAADKWARHLGQATEQIRHGVQAVTQSPTEKAAARQDAYVAGVNRAAANGKWKRGLQRVSLQDWQKSMLEKGLPRVASGASAGKPKFQRFFEQWIPHLQGLQSKLASMPRGDLQQNIARAVAAIQHNSEFKYTG